MIEFLLSAVIILLATVALRVFLRIQSRVGILLIVFIAIGILYFAGWLCHMNMELGSAWKAAALVNVLLSPIAFWFAVLYTFLDEFRLKAWHYCLVAGRFVVALAVYPHNLPNIYEGFGSIPKADLIPNVIYTLLFIGHSITVMLRTLQDDLVEPRRKLRVLIAVFTGIQVIFWLAADVFLRNTSYGVYMDGLGLASIVIFIMVLLVTSDNHWAEVFRGVKAAQPENTQAKSGLSSPKPVPVVQDSGGSPDLLSKRAIQSMKDEQLFRREGLTIGKLAAIMEVQEYKLRRAINTGLGYRNFNELLNECRIEEAKRFLSDPNHHDYPLINLALDLGYAAPGPFNRAFRTATGTSPSEYRKAAIS